MQRTEDNLVVISCDFCGDDWDEVKPMIEGHLGSVICLSCFQSAYEQTAAGGAKFKCTMCLRELGESEPRWRHPSAPASANAAAVICRDCIDQAAGAFDRDEDVPWKKD